MRGRFSEAQILDFLRAAAAGTPVVELCWNHCFSRSTFRAWKSKYPDALAARGARLAQLERENAQLRKALGERANAASMSGAHRQRVRDRHSLAQGRDLIER